MKKIIFGIGGVILGGMLGGAIWTVSAAVLLPILQGLLTLAMAAGGGYLAYQYASREEHDTGRWRD